jgi:hypothetical protein
MLSLNAGTTEGSRRDAPGSVVVHHAALGHCRRVPAFSRCGHIPATRARPLEVNLEIEHWRMTE